MTVQEFIKKSKKANSPDTPQAGPKGKEPSSDLSTRIDVLLKKKTMTPDDVAELDKLISEVQAQEASATQ